MKLSSEDIIWNAENWWGISLPNCSAGEQLTDAAGNGVTSWADEDALRDILHDGSLRSDLAEQLPTPWDDPDESPDSEDVECVARVIEALVECYLAGDTPSTGDLNAIINFAESEFEANPAREEDRRRYGIGDTCSNCGAAVNWRGTYPRHRP